MKKIMFNDRFCLTQAVLDGRKTMTRRIVHKVWLNDDGSIYEHSESLYKIGEVVAVAQSYKDAGVSPYFIAEEFEPQVQFTPGWNNKMFVKAWPLPHRIRITDIKVERLQDISDEDCLREGIRLYGGNGNSSKDFPLYGFDDFEKKIFHNYATPREAFANLIDKVSGKGTWDRNPYVVAYSFELVQYKKGASK